MARNYLTVTDRNRGEMVTTAAARLAQAAMLPGDPKLSRDMRLPDGKVIAAGTPFPTALDEIRAVHATEAAKALPDFRLPLAPNNRDTAGARRYPTPFLPTDANSILPGATALVRPRANSHEPIASSPTPRPA